MPSLSFRDITPWRAAVAVFVGATATIVGAWIFQFAGIVPCELCLKERWFYYGGIPLAALVAVVASRGPRMLVLPGLLLLAVVFAGSAVFGAYHAGVEWHFWQGPTECTGALSSAPTVNDFLQQLQNTKITQCRRRGDPHPRSVARRMERRALGGNVRRGSRRCVEFRRQEMTSALKDARCAA